MAEMGHKQMMQLEFMVSAPLRRNWTFALSAYHARLGRIASVIGLPIGLT